jgi:hypothetical protein
MDLSFSNLRRLRYNPPSPSNSTSVSSAQVPTILDAFIPGYTFFCKLFRDNFGVDVSNIVFTFFALIFCATGFRYLVTGVSSQLSRYCTAAVTVDSNDFVYDCILDWAAGHPTLGTVRSLHVHSVVKGLSVDANLSSAEHASAEGTPSHGQNSAEKMARTILQYDIYKGAHWFWHNGHFYKLAREDQQGSGMTVENPG